MDDGGGVTTRRWPAILAIVAGAGMVLGGGADVAGSSHPHFETVAGRVEGVRREQDPGSRFPTYTTKTVVAYAGHTARVDDDHLAAAAEAFGPARARVEYDTNDNEVEAITYEGRDFELGTAHANVITGLVLIPLGVLAFLWGLRRRRQRPPSPPAEHHAA